MALIQGADIKIELFYSGSWHDLTCDTTSCTWSWGAPEALGPLTECEGGTLRVSLYDPNRQFDPENPSSPLLGVLKVGSPFRVTVDASPAWTGVLQTWGWDRGSSIADLNGLDPIGMLSVRMLPDRFDLQNAATTAVHAQFILDKVEWPSGQRYFPGGTAGVAQGNHYVEGSALDGLQQSRFAELGRLYPMRDGKIGWHTRAGPTPPASSAIINCGGVGLTDMWKAFGLGRVRNHVVVSFNIGVWGRVLPPDEYRSVKSTPAFLNLYTPAPEEYPWDLWANTILDNLDPPPILTVLDTMVPTGAQVKQLVCAEFGARWTVKVTGQPDTLVQVFGMTVDVEPGTIEVTAVTEDVVTLPPVLTAYKGTGSGWLSSTSNLTGTFGYDAARAGTGTINMTVNSPDVFVGQAMAAANAWEVREVFLWFDTSSIPVGATILDATFAAMIHKDWPGSAGGNTFTDFDIQVRSGYAWRPTLAAADWRPGANLGSLTLRATANTSRDEAFIEWSDAGSGLKGAIVKGGETQLVIVSSRTTSGTAPPSVTAFESVWLDHPRLRITYQ